MRFSSARLGRNPRQSLLPQSRGRPVVQPVRLERVHPPEAACCASCSGSDAGRGAVRRRLHARGRPERPAAAAAGRLRRGDGGRAAARDVLDLAKNRFATMPCEEVVAASPDLPVTMFASRKVPVGGATRRGGRRPPAPVGFHLRLALSATRFVDDMREILETLRRPTTTRSTWSSRPTSFRRELPDQPRQCRPLKVKRGEHRAAAGRLAPGDIVLDAGGHRGTELLGPVDGWSTSPPPPTRRCRSGPPRHRPDDRPADARRGAKTRRSGHALGPGGGESTPSLGGARVVRRDQPVSCSARSSGWATAWCPTCRWTHFFNDLVESDILYMAVAPGRAGNS